MGRRWPGKENFNLSDRDLSTRSSQVAFYAHVRGPPFHQLLRLFTSFVRSTESFPRHFIVIACALCEKVWHQLVAISLNMLLRGTFVPG